MTPTDTQEFEEVSIGTVSGLQAFLRNVQTQYNFGLIQEAELLAEANRNQDDALHTTFQAIRQSTRALIEAVQNGTEVNERDATYLQREYDTLVRIVVELKQLVEKKKPAFSTNPLPAPSTDSTVAPVLPVPKFKSSTQTVPEPATETVPTKPKTGDLKIASDDMEVINVKNRISLKPTTKNHQSADSEKSKSLQSKNKTSTKFDSAQKIVQTKKLEAVVEHSQQRYHALTKKYPMPNVIQELLFEEVRESIEHLEILAKKPNHDLTEMSAVAEVASHIKYALEGIDEATKKNGTKARSKQVPVVTESASQGTKSNETKKITTQPQFVSFVPTSVTTKKPTVARRSIPRQLYSLPKPADIYALESLTEKYLTAPRYRQHINDHYSSSESFEQLLDATITNIEAQTIDAIEKWLGDIPASAFAFVQDMPVTELETFANRSFAEVTRDLQQQNIKYETFVVWRDMIEDMLPVVKNGRAMTFGELFARWMIELDMQER